MVGLKLNNNIGKEVSWRIPPQPSLLYSLWMGYPAPYYENLRYVVGSAEIITSNDCKYISIQDLATKQTAEMLQNPEWKTQCD